MTRAEPGPPGFTGPAPSHAPDHAPGEATAHGPAHGKAPAPGDAPGCAPASSRAPASGLAAPVPASTAPAGRADPIEEHVSALASALHGPVRVKVRILTEVRDGLTDAAAAFASHADPRAAAVRDFGPVGEAAAAFQRELAIAQARSTARVVAFAAPVLAACWFLVTVGGRGLPLLAAHLGGVTAATALLATAALAAARRLPTPRRLPTVVAWTGTAAGLALAVSALTLTATSAFAGNWVLSALIGALTIASHARVAASARACRTCARALRAQPQPA